jgi:RND superfamily putative drug exporter
MSSLLVFPQRFLVSMGLGGVIVALVAAAATLLVLPSLAVLLAGRIGRVRPRQDRHGAWYRVARLVMRRPAVVAMATMAVLVVAALPVLGVRWSGIDASVLPASQSARVVSDTLARDFPANQNMVTVAAQAPASAGPRLSGYAARLDQVPGVSPLSGPVYLGGQVWRIDLSVAGDPISDAAQRTVSDLRAITAPVQTELGGAAATFADEKASVAGNWPAALAVLIVLTLLVLWLMTGSLVLPFQALVMNGLTAAAATGLLVFIFQDGRLTGPLGYTSQGGIELTDFLVLGAIVFALSTDYGVLLVTRIKEAHDAGLPTREAVARGLERTGRLVSAAALMLAVAVGAFATSKVVFLKEVGVGVAVAVLIDAFIVRGALVPSLMAWLGNRNWWSPRALRRLHQRLGIAENAPAPTPEQHSVRAHDLRN